jgi:hypothetical protein
MKLSPEKQRLVDLIRRQQSQPLHEIFQQQLAAYVKDTANDQPH